MTEHQEHEPEPGTSADDVAYAELAYVRRVLQVAERGTVGTLALLCGAAIFAAAYGDGLPVHPLALVLWSFGAAVSGVTMAATASLTDVGPTRRRVIGSLLLLAVVGCSTGVVAAADGIAGPVWVIFLPMTVVVGAVCGAVPGLSAGALSSAGVYGAAVLSHTLSTADIGRLVILLPAFPAVGLAAGALCAAAHQAAAEARTQRAALTRDVEALAGLLDAVADGDLTGNYSSPEWSDPATEGLAVVLADTLIALRRLVGGLVSASGQLTGSADEIAASAEIHVRAVELQAVAVTETTSTIEQLAATATAIAQTSDRVSDAAAESRSDATTGVAAVGASMSAAAGLADRVRGLLDRSQRLGELVDAVRTDVVVMDELARRTTMLALSAAIEAAQAGEHAAGFANVAREIRALANRARAATASIDAIVDQLRAEVDATARAAKQGVQAVAWGLDRHHDVVRELDDIRQMIDSTAVAAREINTATAQQRLAADAVVAAMGSVTMSSTNARTTTSRHALSAAELQDLAHDVQTSVGRFVLPTRPVRSAA